MTDKNIAKVKQAQPARPVTRQTIAPLVDIYEDEEGTNFLVAELPGVTMDNVDIRVEKGVLTLSAQAMPRSYGEKFAEQYRGFEPASYQRAFALSDEVDRDKIEASMRDGVLTLKLPRAAAAKTRKIEIKNG